MKKSKLAGLIDRIKSADNINSLTEGLVNLNDTLSAKIFGGNPPVDNSCTNTGCTNGGCNNSSCSGNYHPNNSSCTNSTCNTSSMQNSSCVNNGCNT